MTRQHFTPNPDLYRTHFRNQSGGNLPGFQGSRMQYGEGLGSFFSSIARKAVPLLRSGFKMAAPHMKKAAAGIAKDVFNSVMKQTGIPPPSNVYKRQPQRVKVSSKRARHQITSDIFDNASN